MERQPRSGALVIARDDAGVFALCDRSGVPQIVCDTFQELLQLAVHFTRDEQAQLWYAESEGRYRPVVDTAVLQRVWNGFLENPTRRVTREQAHVLWDADGDGAACAAALDTLVALRLAAHDGSGEYGALAASF